jgi:uncharacterized protein
MEVIFDNNVLISAALLKDSIPFKAFEKALSQHTLIRSYDLLSEFRNTIFKPKFDKYFVDDLAREDFVMSFIIASKDIKVTSHVYICRDPKDNMYLELALSGNASIIVTGDGDLLVLNPFCNISIITPKDFLTNY